MRPLAVDQRFKQTLQLGLIFLFLQTSLFLPSLFSTLHPSLLPSPHVTPPPPTALFTLSTEPPRENVFPKKTNVEEPEVGVGESLSPVRKTELPTAAEDSEMQAR